MAEDTKRNIEFYLKFLTPASIVVGQLALGSLWVLSYAGKTDQTAAAITALTIEYRETIHTVLNKLEAMPLDRQRLDQIEKRVQEIATQNGGLDARQQITERQTAVNTAGLADIRSASATRLRP